MLIFGNVTAKLIRPFIALTSFKGFVILYSLIREQKEIVCLIQNPLFIVQ